ncbi:MAG: AcrR family transcriptional regulator [Paraglaciecola sp.]|jgi:AcrR family transcriptional regulator
MPPLKNNKISSPFSKTIQHDQKYKTILSAASELFNVYGTRATTLVQIANKLNLTKTSLYYYAKNKEELVHQCYLNTCIEIQSMITEVKESDGSAINKIETLLRLNFECWNGIINGSRGHLAGLTEIASLSAVHQQEISEYYRTFVLQVMEFIDQGQLDGSVQAVSPVKASSALWGAIMWLPVWLYSVEEEHREAAYSEWLSILKFGLNKATTAFHFKSVDFAKEQIAPDGFDRNEQNRIKQEAFYRVGSIFFNKKGFKGTSLDELAQSLGVTKGAFYYHIKNKDDLLVKCFERTINIERTVLDNALAIKSSGVEKLAYAAQKLFSIQAGEQGPLIRYARMWSLDIDKKQEVEIATSKVRDLFGSIIQQGIDDNSIKKVDLLVAENIIAGAIESIPDLGDNINEEDIMGDSADFFHIFLNGIAK